MSVGPVEYIAIAFPGNKFSGEIVPAIKALQDSGTIRVLDLVLITKDAQGNVAAIELADAEPEQRAVLDVLGIERKNLLGEEDFEDIGSALDPNSTAGMRPSMRSGVRQGVREVGRPDARDHQCGGAVRVEGGSDVLEVPSPSRFLRSKSRTSRTARCSGSASASSIAATFPGNSW